MAHRYTGISCKGKRKGSRFPQSGNITFTGKRKILLAEQIWENDIDYGAGNRIVISSLFWVIWACDAEPGCCMQAAEISPPSRSVRKRAIESPRPVEPMEFGEETDSTV